MSRGRNLSLPSLDCFVCLCLALSNVNRAYCSFHGKLYRGARKTRATLNSAIELALHPRITVIQPARPPTTPTFSHAQLLLAAVLCVHPVYYVLTLNTLTRAQRVSRSLCPHLPLVIFTGVIFSALKATPLSRTKAREGKPRAGGEVFRFSLAFDTDGHETKFRFGVGTKEDL